MTLRIVEGFDHYTVVQSSAKGWGLFPSNPQTVVAGRLGGQAWQFGSGIGSITRSFPAGSATFSGTTVVCGCAYRMITGANNTQNQQLSIGPARWGTDTSRRLFLMNAAGTVVATGTTILNIGQWYYIELKVSPISATGSALINLNGLPEIAATSSNYGTTQPTGINLNSSTGTSTAAQYDDIYILDGAGATNNDLLGDCRVETIFPSGDGANLQWTPNSGGVHFNRVNETTPDGDTTYNANSVAGNRDSYTFPALSIAAGSVFGLAVNLYTRKDDAATRQVAPVIRQGGVNFDGTTGTPALSTSYAYYTQTYDQDPTGSNWSIATVNGDEFGIKEVL